MEWYSVMGLRYNKKRITSCHRKVCHYYFPDNFSNSGPSLISFSLLNSERIYGERWNQNYHLHINLVLHYLVKCELSTIHLYIHISEKNMPSVRWHLFG